MIYTLYQPAGMADADNAFDGMRIVPEKVAPLAIVFPPFWLAWHRLWFPLAVYGLVAAIIAALVATPFWAVGLVLGGLPALYLWLEGHQLRRNKLERNGYQLVDVVEAKDAESALARHIALATDGDVTMVEPS